MRADLHPSYILHRWPYRETSLILECLSADYGRVGVVARGAMRGRKRGGETMQVFQPCQISWSGRSELRTLIKFEPVGNALQLVGERLFSGFYVNELTMRMTTRQDPNLELYSVYQQTILSLARTSVAIELILRRFEKSLLDACGYGMQLLAEANSGADIDPTQSYCYAVEYGPDPSSNAPDGIVVSGQTLLALAGRREFEVDELREAKRLMRFVLRHYIGDRPLSSRSLFRKPNRNNHSPK